MWFLISYFFFLRIPKVDEHEDEAVEKTPDENKVEGSRSHPNNSPLMHDILIK